MNKADTFYGKVVRDLICDKNASILVCGAQLEDRDVFRDLGLSNVLLSGMDDREFDYAPYKWVKMNAESLSFPDGSFDYVVIHTALHHTQSPHRVLTEMYRVGKKGILAFEGPDTFLVRIAEKYGLTQKYEVAGTYPGNGVNGTDIPNYIYRWTEREIEKTINTYAPSFRHKFIYKYGSLYPDGPDLSVAKRIIIKTLRPFYYLFVKIFPRQQNQLAFFVEKPGIPDSLYPWLYYNDDEKKIGVNYDWISKYYTRLKYRRT